MAQGAAQGCQLTGGSLAPVGFQKLQPGRGVVENVPHGHGGALRAAPGEHVLNVSGFEDDAGSLNVAFAAGVQLDF